MKDLDGTIALVTGANTGVGLETARGLAARGATVVMAARNLEKGRKALEDVRESTGSDALELLQLDLASFDSIRAAAAEFLSRHDALHLLINNAGLMLSDRRETVEGFEQSFGVNHLGHFLLTTLLLDTMKASAPARIVNVSSEGHRMTRGLDFTDLNRERRRYRGMAAYCDSKLANVLFTRELARRLEGTGVVAHALHPGFVRSSFAKDGDTNPLIRAGVFLLAPFAISPHKGAETSLHVATSDEAGETSGDYWNRSKRSRIARPGQDADAARKLWDVSERLIAEASPAEQLRRSA